MYNALLGNHGLFKEYIYLFFFVMAYHPEKNDRKLHHSRWCMIHSLPHFFSGDSSINKQNKSIHSMSFNYTKTHILYNKMLCFMMFLHYFLWRLIILWRLNIYITDGFFFSCDKNYSQYLLLHGTWSYLRICRRSVMPYTRFCNCLLDYDLRFTHC
jgi:hypothetical protein